MENTLEITGCLAEKNGKYHTVVYLIENGKRVPSWKTTGLPIVGNKRRAEKILRQRIQEFEEVRSSRTDSPVALTQSNLILCDYLNKFVDLRLSTEQIRPNTAEGYYSNIRIHFVPHWKDTTLEQLNAEKIEKFYEDRALSGLSMNSVNKLHTLLFSAIKYAVRKDKLLNKNVVEEVDVPKYDKPTIRYLTLEQLNLLLERAKDSTVETAVILAVYYGFRRSEVAGLRWSAIDFSNKTIHISHTRVRYEKDIVGVDKTKSKASMRTMPLIPQVEEHLLEVKAKQEENRRFYKNTYHNSDYILTWEDGRIYRPDYITSAFSKLMKRTKELPYVSFHDLRHSCATMLLTLGYNMKYIQEWLGHEDLESTQIYAHLEYENKVSMANSLGDVLSQSS